jgi:hypothetical protein
MANVAYTFTLWHNDEVDELMGMMLKLWASWRKQRHDDKGA